jgi:hypothetical protein
MFPFDAVTISECAVLHRAPSDDTGADYAVAFYAREEAMLAVRS